MAQDRPPEQTIRDWLESNGPARVGIGAIEQTWGISPLDAADRREIAAALESAGVLCEPPLTRAGRNDRLRLSVAELAEEPPPAPAEPAAEDAPPAPAEPPAEETPLAGAAPAEETSPAEDARDEPPAPSAPPPPSPERGEPPIVRRGRPRSPRRLLDRQRERRTRGPVPPAQTPPRQRSPAPPKPGPPPPDIEGPSADSPPSTSEPPRPDEAPQPWLDPEPQPDATEAEAEPQPAEAEPEPEAVPEPEAQPEPDPEPPTTRRRDPEARRRRRAERAQRDEATRASERERRASRQRQPKPAPEPPAEGEPAPQPVAAAAEAPTTPEAPATSSAAEATSGTRSRLVPFGIALLAMAIGSVAPWSKAVFTVDTGFDRSGPLILAIAVLAAGTVVLALRENARSWLPYVAAGLGALAIAITAGNFREIVDDSFVGPAWGLYLSFVGAAALVVLSMFLTVKRD